ncbi:MAG TPA: tRNA-binding protein [Actinomycetota bacterium]|nr:tRNA-binding protein [Actinomycetota bacterium]
MAPASIEDLERLDIRVGTVTRCEPFPEARKPAYKLWIDFGSGIGLKASSARITDRYEPGDLPGRQVLGVVNFPPRRVGPFVSEVLTLGVYADRDVVVLVSPDGPVPNGSRLG